MAAVLINHGPWLLGFQLYENPLTETWDGRRQGHLVSRRKERIHLEIQFFFIQPSNVCYTEESMEICLFL